MQLIGRPVKEDVALLAGLPPPIGLKRFLRCLNGRVDGLSIASLDGCYDFPRCRVLDLKSLRGIRTRPSVLRDIRSQLENLCG